MIDVALFTRDGCHLCEQVEEDLRSLESDYPHRLVTIDIESDEKLLKEYGFEIPVVKIGPYTLKAPIERHELQVTLGAAIDRQRHIREIENSTKVKGPATWTRADRFTYGIARHYLAFFNILVVIYLGLPFLAPTLAKAGAQAPANLIYRAYSAVCHQLAYRSFFLFGEQSVYPRAAAGVDGVLTYNQATGLGEGSSVDEIFTARRYTGDEQVGYKVALCERDVAIYGGILIFGLVYAATGRRWPSLPWYLWILIGMAPIALDGFSQLLSQPPINLWAFRESTPALRTLTGFLFGFSTAWFGYPMVEETMADTREVMGAKRRRALEAGVIDR